MNRVLLNAVADLILALVMLGVLVTGLVMRWVLPPGSQRTHALWGMDRHGWGDLHFWLAAAAVLIVLVHVALHWQWVVSTVRRWVLGLGAAGATQRVRAWTGVTTLLIVALATAGFIFFSSASVEVDPEAEPRRAGASEQHSGMDEDTRDRRGEGRRAADLEVEGRMTLQQAAEAAGLSLEQARTRLGLPADTPGSARMGRLGSAHDFTMSEARRRLARE